MQHSSAFEISSALDEDSISVVHDGTDALTVTFSNSNENIPCSALGIVLQDYIVTLPFSAYSGLN
jgi:hypothetical protein